MAKTKKTPEIRFKGFTEEWEERQLGKIMNVASAKRIHQSDWTDFGVKFFRARDIVSAVKNEEPNDCLYISKAKYEENSSISGKVAIGDMLVTGVGTIGVPFLIRNLEPLYFKDGNIIWFQNKEIIDDNFFYYSFIGSRIQDYIHDSAGIGTVGTYTIESGKKTPISLPQDEEQIKIGCFFQNLDSLIALHQRKHDKLCTVKKAMLEKMFPKEGADVPEIRFKGFTGKWERRKLGEEKDVRDGTHASPQYHSEGHPLVTSKNLSDAGLNLSEVSLISDYDFNEINKRSKVGIGDIIFGMIGTIGNPVVVNREDISIKNVALIKNSGSVINEFLIYLFKSNIFNEYIRNEYSGSTQTFLGLNKIRDFGFLSPKYDEQRRIGSFFQHIDSLITLHQRELDKLRNIKKACLEKMFV